MTEMVANTRDGAVFTITITREARRNALNAEVAAGILAGLAAAEADPGVRAIVLTGAGDKAFCAGGDLAPSADGAPFHLDPADPRHYLTTLFRAMEACRLPLIARVNGPALAGGYGLMCGCDLVVAREDALMGVPEVKVGLFPMMILPFLLRATPHRVLMEMCLTGEPLTAAEAKLHGIVNYAVPADQLEAKLAWLLGRILDKSPSGIRLGKQGLRRVREMGFDAALDYAPLMLATMAQTADAREGFAAFAEKRRPQWTGR